MTKPVTNFFIFTDIAYMLIDKVVGLIFCITLPHNPGPKNINMAAARGPRIVAHFHFFANISVTIRLTTSITLNNIVDLNLPVKISHRRWGDNNNMAAARGQRLNLRFTRLFNISLMLAFTTFMLINKVVEVDREVKMCHGCRDDTLTWVPPEGKNETPIFNKSGISFWSLKWRHSLLLAKL